MADAIPTKQCTYCKQVKPLDAYGRHKSCAGGLNPQCKACNRQRVSEYQAARGEEYRQHKHEYDKRRWAEGKSVSKSEWRQANREHLNRKKAEWAQQNPDKARSIRLTYKYRRRLQEGTGIGWAELQRWTAAQKKVCYWCGTRCTKGFHVDHYTPLSKGGKHETDNLVISCAPCNLRKSAKDPLDFAREVGRLL